MKAKIIFTSGCFIFLALALTACANKRIPSGSSLQNALSAQVSALGRDAHADTSLGALSQKRGSEAIKEAEELAAQDEASDTLQELSGSDTNEELQRIQRSIVEFDKTEDQIRQQ